MKQTLQQKIVGIMSRCADMTVATLRPDGAPQATAVSSVHDGLLLYFGCSDASQKAANIARDPRISIAMTEPYDDWLMIRGLSMAATATEVSVPGELAEVARLMLYRFPQISTIDAMHGAVNVFRVRPRIVSVLDYSLGFGHTDLVAVESDDISESLGSMRHHWLIPAEAAM
ncbi:pyridoxamine 5'-phosphate oxidase family protein [soil metagenome]